MDILRLEKDVWHGLYRMAIYGLRIKHVNEGTESLEEPMITLLRETLSAIPCAAQMSWDPWQDEPFETFSAYYSPERFFLTPVGMYSHLTFFHDDQPRGAYFPQFLPDDLTVADVEGDLLIDGLLSYDQPALYLGVDEHIEPALRRLFLDPPPEEKDYNPTWFRAATGIVPLVLVGGHDESCFYAITRSPEHFTLLKEPLAQTERAIRESSWFQENENDLHWSEESWEWCLTFSCGRREHRRKC